MSFRQAGFFLVTLVVITVIALWGDVVDALAQWQAAGADRPKTVTVWSNSGTPQYEKRMARDFMARHEDVYLDINFRMSGNLGSTLHVSFLSGSPPDLMGVARSDTRKMVASGMLRPATDQLEATQAEMPRFVLSPEQPTATAWVDPERAAEDPDAAESWGVVTLVEARDAAAVLRLREAPPTASTRPDAPAVTVDVGDLLPGTPLRLIATDPAAGTATLKTDFVALRVTGETGMVYFRVNPRDPWLARDPETGRFIYPERATRLLKMHGELLGFTSINPGESLTYNRRVFRNAATWYLKNEGTTHGLVDETGRAAPPATWADLLRKARLISEYGRKSGTGVYGIVIQGQQARDIRRSIEPLMATAGTRGFDFRTGRFEYDGPAAMAAFKLLMRLKADGSVLPGTSSRQFEESRGRLAQGDAAMLIDGWHSAMIAVDRVPYARNDIGSATIPVPYGLNDDGTPVADQKAEIETLLGVEGLGRGLPYLGGFVGTDCLTSGCDAPRATWQWMNFSLLDPELEKIGVSRGSFPASMLAKKHLDDPEWFPYPYQQQVAGLMDLHELWPEAPNRPQVSTDHQNILQAAFLTHELDAGAADFERQLAAIAEDVEADLADYTRQINAELRRMVDRGQERPQDWTFTGFDPMRPQQTFEAQQQGSGDPEVAAEIAELRGLLPPEVRDMPAHEVFGEFETTANPWQVLYIPAMMLTVVLAFVVVTGARSKTADGPTLALTARRARRNWYAYLFVLPAMLALFSLVLYPTFYQVYLALRSGSGIGPMRYVGLEHFRYIFGFSDRGWDQTFWTKVLPNTALYMVVVTAGQVGLGLIIANLLNLSLRVNHFTRILFFIPLVTSMAAIAVVFLGLLGGPDSAVNGMLAALGLEDLPYWLGLVEQPVAEGGEHDWLGSPKTDLYSVMLVAIWHGLPYNIILILAALQAIDPQLYEAAKVDGASPPQRFFHVTIPEILPILVVIIFNALIGAARAFGAVFILTEGGKDHSSEVVATYIFKWGFTKLPDSDPDLGYASALGIVYAVILAMLAFTNVYLIARRWRRRLATEQRGTAESDTAESDTAVGAAATRTATEPGPGGLQRA